MELQKGDKILIEGDVYILGDLIPGSPYYNASYWLQNEAGNTQRYEFEDDLKKHISSGKYLLMNRDPAAKSQSCVHSLRRYTGFINVFDYCDKCDQKWEVKWHDIR